MNSTLLNADATTLQAYFWAGIVCIYILFSIAANIRVSRKKRKKARLNIYSRPQIRENPIQKKHY